MKKVTPKKVVKSPVKSLARKSSGKSYKPKGTFNENKYAKTLKKDFGIK